MFIGTVSLTQENHDFSNLSVSGFNAEYSAYSYLPGSK